MTLPPADTTELESSLFKKQNPLFPMYRIKARIRNTIVWGIVLIAAFLFTGSCGNKRARTEPPVPPPVPTVQSADSSGTVIPPVSTQTPAEIPPVAVVEIPVIPAAEEEPSEPTPLGPNIRIGLLTDAAEIRISSNGDFYVMANEPETPRRPVQGNIHVRVEQDGESENSATCFRIQAASLGSRESAEALRKNLAETFRTTAVVRANDEETLNRVRVGEFPTRTEAEELWERMKRSGYPDSYIVEDTRPKKPGKPVLALRGGDNLFLLNSTGFLFLPSSDTNFLSINGRPYRGILDIRLNSSKRITAVNQLRLEEYLRGVVPAEMSPSHYPEFDALAAQSIVARTYALKHMGQYQSQGFDLTDDTYTQVYQGTSAEKKASDDAVRRTAGIAIYYEDKLIDAMYMSTCGGRTEDSSNVYGTQPVPYLKSVACAVEGGGLEPGTLIGGSHSLKVPVLSDDGNVANRNLEFARILGIIDPGSGFSAESLSEAAINNEAGTWIKNALKVIKKSPKKAEAESLETRIGFLKYAAESVFGADDIERKISARDASYYMDNLKDGGTVPEEARAALAYLMQKSLWHPFPDNTVRPNNPVTRGEALSLLLGWIEFVQPDILHHGVLTGAGSFLSDGSSASELEIKWGSSTKKFRLSDSLPLFRVDAERKIPVDHMKIIGNEHTHFHFDPDDTIDFLEVELNPTGASSDRYSPAATWEVTISRSDVEKKLRAMTGNIGVFKDIEPARIGNSGRAVEIRVTGSQSSIVLNGYRVRGALELRDTLFTLTRKLNPDGTIAEFTFHGRGFGHGIGLCQVGAFGMAKAGKNYEEILKTYYTGVEIRKAY